VGKGTGDIGPDDRAGRAGRLLIRVRGAVQGVGFRPYVYGLATRYGLRGFVSNTSEGVTIEVEGEGLEEFVEKLKEEAPPLARITEVELTPLLALGYGDFRIVESVDRGSFTLISPDVSVCEDCLREMRDPADRRHRYPFINCTNCGPRYSITRRVPYDRPNTTMASFEMCADCRREYEDPASRRYHAEPIACPACGPRVFLQQGGEASEGEEAISKAIGILREGGILAVKGLGGFHLACDAANAGAVEELRQRKRKNNKPFALMAADMEIIKRHCHVSEREEAVLLSRRRPIVLLDKKEGGSLPGAISPDNRKIGFMLPYTPLHYLLMEGIEAAVMTSGNLSEEPIQIHNEEALGALAGIANAFLLHDREIFMRVDDPVVKLPEGMSPVFIRRARGYAPEPVTLSSDGPDVLACGADIKNTFTLMKGRYAIVSQHIGDMENHETLGFFEETLGNLKAVYRAEPVALAHDMHPGYFSTRWALEQPMKKLAVQHHHAHIASVMAGRGLAGKVIGIALDGTGYGPDGTLWGGEFLIASPLEFRRAGHFSYVPLPGGESAVREPWRMAVSLIRSVYGREAEDCLERIGFFERFGERNVRDVLRVCGMREFSPLTSGAGRLFDAVSSLLDIRHASTFEGEAAMALEARAAGNVDREYPVDVKSKDPMEVDFSYALICIINDMLSGKHGCGGRAQGSEKALVPHRHPGRGIKRRRVPERLPPCEGGLGTHGGRPRRAHKQAGAAERRRDLPGAGLHLEGNPESRQASIGSRMPMPDEEKKDTDVLRNLIASFAKKIERPVRLIAAPAAPSASPPQGTLTRPSGLQGPPARRFAPSGT